jgi:hypothetical protein
MHGHNGTKRKASRGGRRHAERRRGRRGARAASRRFE